MILFTDFFKTSKLPRDTCTGFCPSLIELDRRPMTDSENHSLHRW